MIPMKIAQSKIALFFACILIWTLGMSLLSFISGNELSATKLGTIIFVGAIIAFVCVLGTHIVKITQSKIAMFFVYLVLWTLGMSFGRVIILSDELNATKLGIIMFFGVIVAFVSVLAIHISQQSSRR